MVEHAAKIHTCCFLRKNPTKRDQRHILTIVALSIKNKQVCKCFCMDEILKYVCLYVCVTVWICKFVDEIPFK